ncbi:DNA polymerase III subunit beta [Celerinatantimonas diazotrophica]|uniref:Beta sliding clamp n=1 Tax=Celerinatantimonas diazotrophica TaxID=412034 RepID=A0A4R1KFD4_9GAMM|nr:DNA polymerase III subunit beta [Celerinatantimonas diazotrophica]TCK63352.1 DNA polymerase III beta subunit [Celerinatantimonas diazotrophica]CAG9294896.1 Beta sliding clamp [Celerinatantimonas diazotrophica]
MQFQINREALIKPLQLVSSAIGGRPTVPILGNILLVVSENSLSLTGTDMEVELVASVGVESAQQLGSVTVPAKKFVDICKGLPDGCSIECKAQGDRLQIRSGRSRFSLATLPAEDYPNVDSWQPQLDLSINQAVLKQLIDNTQFSMASQDVRYYLNGMLFETEGQTLKTVGCDGHRIAVASTDLGQPLESLQVIVPRKGVLELIRLLDQDDAMVQIQIGTNNIRASVEGFTFTCKLVDGRFPDYKRVIPSGGNKVLISGREELRQAFSRAAILSNEKFRGVRLQLTAQTLTITANNPEQEEAEEILDVAYQGDDLEIGFNVSYLLDVLNALKSDQVRITMSDSITGSIIEDSEQSGQALYVIMPMRL